ncbi:septum formation initiator family protein [Anaerococcus sp. mt242]|uniref:septum formation initiator family protein n=1 Tax=Anaerococcus sp. mt242 TaxID=2661917 RepID=UPI0019315EAD|nr:septum formation initiator family protein [Anaerococcus sp. mt242]MBM0045904.1 septum formation initiator family protein [Anaerococcus sp. mt242]
MARAKSYQKKRKAKNRRFLLSIFLILILSTIAYVFLNNMMNAEINTLNSEINSTKKKLDAVNEEITSLESDYEIRNTDQFKEKIAKERLGMVKGKKPILDEEEKDNKEDKEKTEELDQETNNDSNE